MIITDESIERNDFQLLLLEVLLHSTTRASRIHVRSCSQLI